MSISRALYVDDRDPSIIYSSLEQNVSGRIWRPFRGAASEFMQTTTHANKTGATAEIIFAGSDITVFGTVSPASSGNSDPLSHYILDSNQPYPFRPLPNNDTQYNVLFYESPKNLSSGLHTLQIVLRSMGNYWLDYMVIDGTDRILSAGNYTSPISNSAAAPQSISTATYAHTHTLIFSAAASATSKAPTRAPGGLIASIVLGSILGFALLLSLLSYICRRRPNNHSHDSENALTPFNSLTRGFNDDNTRAQVSEVTPSNASPGPSRLNKPWRTTVPVLHPEPPPVYQSSRPLSGMFNSADIEFY